MSLHLSLKLTTNWAPLSSIKWERYSFIKKCISFVHWSSFIIFDYVLGWVYEKYTKLPKHRVNLIYPFQHTGVNKTGHIWIGKEKKTTKMFLLIFTCFNIQAVHIEIVPVMVTMSFVQVLTCFTNIYRIPSHIYSDNAKSFNSVSGKNIYDVHLNSKLYYDTFVSSAIKHIKLPLYSP